MIELMAAALLITVWIFGGATLFVNPAAKYPAVLIGWSVLSTFVAVTMGLFCAAFWTIEKLLLA